MLQEVYNTEAQVIGKTGGFIFKVNSGSFITKRNTLQKPAFSFSPTLATCAWALLTRVALTQKVLL